MELSGEKTSAKGVVLLLQELKKVMMPDRARHVKAGKHMFFIESILGMGALNIVTGHQFFNFFSPILP